MALHYLSDPAAAPNIDVLILPGTKNTVADLGWLRAVGWEDFLVRHRRGGGWVVEICGGYQMLGQRIVDNERIESDRPETVALGLLAIETIFQPAKITERVGAVHLATGLRNSRWPSGGRNRFRRNLQDNRARRSWRG